MTTDTLRSAEARQADTADTAVYAKVAWRLLPLMVVMYFVNTLDRVNVAFAALQMNEALGFTPYVYGWGAGIFFVGYFLCEVPSNIVMNRVGPRLWMARIMLTWGVLSCATAFVTTPTSFYVVRFLLGVAEAGFVPGMLFYLGLWFPKRYLAGASSLFLVAAPLTTVVGAPLSGWILQTHGIGGLAGWQWLFLIEGAPAVLLAVVALLFLTDSPRDAGWLTEPEKAGLVRELDQESRATHPAGGRTSLWSTLTDGRVLALSLVYFFVVVGLYGVGFWLPQIVRRADSSMLQVGLITALPYLFGAIGCVVWGRHSDHKQERRWHIIGATLLAAVGLAISGFATDASLGLAALCVAAMGIYASLPSFWSLPHGLFKGASGAAAIALINSVGNLGGFLGPYLVGWLKQSTGGFQAPLFCLAASLFIGAAVVLLAVREPR